MKLFMHKVIFIFVVSCFIAQLSIIAQPGGFPPWDDFQKMQEARIIKVTIKGDDGFCILDVKKEFEESFFELFRKGITAIKEGRIKEAHLIADCCYVCFDCQELLFTIMDSQYPGAWVDEFDAARYSSEQLREFKQVWDDFLKGVEVEVECSLLVQYVGGKAIKQSSQLVEAMESYYEPKERVVNKEQNPPMRHIVSTTEPASHYFAAATVCAIAVAGIIWLMNREAKAFN